MSDQQMASNTPSQKNSFKIYVTVLTKLGIPWKLQLKCTIFKHLVKVYSFVDFNRFTYFWLLLVKKPLQKYYSKIFSSYYRTLTFSIWTEPWGIQFLCYIKWKLNQGGATMEQIQIYIHLRLLHQYYRNSRGSL